MNSLNLLIVLSILLQFNQCLDSEPDGQTESIGADQQFDELIHDYNLLTKDYLESLKVAHNLVDTEEDYEEVVRSKRSAQVFHRRNDYTLDKGVFRLRGIVPLLPTCDRPLDFTTVVFNSQPYGICVSAAEYGRPARVSVGAITPSGWERNRISWYVRDPRNVVSFVDTDKDTKQSNLYVLVADSASRDGTDVHVINGHNQVITKERHTVNSRFPTAIAVWKSRTDNTYHLAIANSDGPEATRTYKSETFTYNWMRTYFDRYSELITYYVKDICPFSIHSNEFLAVANFKAGPDMFEVDSEIFKLDIDSEKWRSFQRIRTFGAIDWEFFTMGTDRNQEYFLAVANNFEMSHGRIKYDVDSIIYKFVEDKFVPFQCLKTVGATQVKTFGGPNGEFVLAVANMHQAVHLYQYNGWRFVQTSVQYTSGVMSPGVVSLHFDYLPFERTGVLFVSNPHHPSGHMFRLEFAHENPLGDWHQKSIKWCENVDREVSRADNGLQPLFKDIFYVDQSQPIVINDDITIDDLVIDSLSTPMIIDETTGDELSHRMIDQLVQLDGQIAAANRKIDEIVALLANAMRTSGDQVVTAPHVFTAVDFECRPEMNCFVERLNAKMVNNDNVEGLMADVVPLNLNQRIDHMMQFQNLKVDGNVVVNGLINGFNTTNIVTKHGSHDIVAPKTFAADMTANEVTAPLVNKQVISPSTVLLTVGDQVINNTVSFVNGIVVANLQVNGPVNGIDINRFFAELITKDGDHVITGEKHFHYMDIGELLMRPGSTIDSVDPIRLWNDVLWTYGDQEVVAAINFTDISVQSDLKVDGLVNGINITRDVVLRNQNGAIIFGPKRFVRPPRLRRMKIHHSINGIGLIGAPKRQLDLLLKRGEQLITGQKTFNRMHLGGHSPVVGTVDGVKLSHLQRTVLYRNTTQHFDTLEIKGNAVFAEGIALKETINGLKLENIYKNALKLTDSRIPAFANFFVDTIDAKSLECHSINGLDIGRDLMTKNTPQTITGLKVFSGGLRMDNNMMVGAINGVPMNFFGDTLLHDIPQQITGEKTFASDLWVKDLRTPNINGISMDDIVLLNRDETIPAPKHFTDVHVYGDLNVHSIESDVINGVDMRQLYANSLQFETPQTITGRLNVLSFTIPKGTAVETNSVNGIDLKKLAADAVLKDVPQVITGPKTFTAPITIDKTYFRHTFDNVTDHELRHEWLLQDVPQTIAADLHFEQKVRVEDNLLMTVPVINKINLNAIKDLTVKVDEPTVIAGDIRFDKPVVTEGAIHLSGRFQGIDLDKEAVTLDRDHILKGQIHFANGFDVVEHLFVRGTVDGVKVEELCRSAVRKNMAQTITGPTQVTGNLVIKGLLIIAGLLNGINLELFNRSVLKVNEPAVLRGVNTFRILEAVGPIDSRQLFAGFRVEDIWNNYMSLSRDQMVNSRLVFLHDLTFTRGLIIKGHLFTQNSLINGIDLRRLNATVLNIFGNQVITGDYVFEGAVHFHSHLNVLSKRINGLDLLNDFMMRGRPNVVNDPKVFLQDIAVLNDLVMANKKTIAGVDVSEMARFAVMKNKNGKYRVNGHKHFRQLVVDHLKVRLINGVEISPRSLLLTYGHQLIPGFKVLKSGLRVDSEITSRTVNNMNIEQLSRSLVLKGYNNTIQSLMTFAAPLTIHNVVAFGRVDGVDLNELNYFIGLPVNLQDLIVKLNVEDHKIRSVQTALDRRAIDFEYYELIHTIHSGPPLLIYPNHWTHSRHVFVSGQHLPNGCHEVDVFVNVNRDLRPVKKLIAIEANLMTTYRWNADHFIVISNNQKPSSEHCLKLATMAKQRVGVYGSGPAVSQVFVFDSHLKDYRMIAIIRSESVTDIRVIEDYNHSPCLMYAIPVAGGHYGRPLIYCMRPDGGFVLKETSPLEGTDQISIARSSSLNTTLMASINSWATTSGVSSIAVSHWSSQLSHFDYNIQSIPTLNPMTLHFAESPLHSTLFLFVAEKKTSLTHSPLVRVFRYTGQRRATPLMEVQQIKSSFAVKQIESIVLDDKRLVVAMLSDDRLDLYALKGSQGFVLVETIDVQNAQRFVVTDGFNHLIAVHLKECYAKNRNVCKEETHLLRAKFNVN